MKTRENNISPLVSIIIPVYNAGKYLETTISSVLNQSFTNWELVAVDDASTDDSRKILNKFAEADTRIHAIYLSENRGVSNARNVGLSNASGDYICWLDADDFYDSEFLKVMIDVVLSYDCDIVECQSARFQDKPKEISEYSFNIELGDGYDLIKRFGCHTLQTSLWSKIFKCSLFENFKFPIGKIYEEPYFYFEKYDMITKVGYIDIALYNYRNTPGSIMKVISDNAINSNIDIHSYIINKINHINIGKLEKRLVINRVITGATGFWKRLLYANSTNKNLNKFGLLLDSIDAIRERNNVKIKFNSWCVLKFNQFRLFRLLLLLQFKIKKCQKSR